MRGAKREKDRVKQERTLTHPPGFRPSRSKGQRRTLLPASESKTRPRAERKPPTGCSSTRRSTRLIRLEPDARPTAPRPAMRRERANVSILPKANPPPAHD